MTVTAARCITPPRRPDRTPTKKSSPRTPVLKHAPQQNRYVKVKAVGKGTFGTAWLVRPHDSDTLLIMKEISLKSIPQSEKQATRNEVTVLKRLSHPNVVSYVDAHVDRDSIKIIMEYASGGDLAGAIARQKKRGIPFREAEVVRFTSEIASALAHVHHDMKLLHRDLKPANCFLDSHGAIKLGDFGMSCSCGTADMAITKLGTPLYMSPELCAGKPYSRSADAWSLGCILYELMALEPPWIHKMAPRGGVLGLMRLIASSKLSTEKLRLSYSDELVSMCDSLVSKAAEARPTMLEILATPPLAELQISPSSHAGTEATVRPLQDHCSISILGPNPGQDIEARIKPVHRIGSNSGLADGENSGAALFERPIAQRVSPRPEEQAAKGGYPVTAQLCMKTTSRKRILAVLDGTPQDVSERVMERVTAKHAAAQPTAQEGHTDTHEGLGLPRPAAAMPPGRRFLSAQHHPQHLRRPSPPPTVAQLPRQRQQSRVGPYVARRPY